MTRRLLDRFADSLPGPAAPVPDLAELTEREAEVLRLVALALSNAEIAERLVVSEATVKTHVSSILRKLGCAIACRRSCSRTTSGSCGRAPPEVADEVHPRVRCATGPVRGSSRCGREPSIPHTIAKGAAAVLVLAILLNVVPRVVPLPSLDLPSLGIPDLPEVPGWARTLLKVKNWLLIGIAVVVVIGFVADEIEKHRRGTEDSER